MHLRIPLGSRRSSHWSCITWQGRTVSVFRVLANGAGCPPYEKEARVPWTDAGPGSLPAVYSDSRSAFDGMERKAGTALECTPPSKDQTFALLVTVGDEASIFTRLGFSCTETSVGRSARSSRTEDCDRSGIAHMCGRQNQSTLVGSQCLSALNS
jgi:hypothetical protein